MLARSVVGMQVGECYLENEPTVSAGDSLRLAIVLCSTTTCRISPSAPINADIQLPNRPFVDIIHLLLICFTFVCTLIQLPN